jgi:hypothetical protein
MAIRCALGMHVVISRGVRNGHHVFGRCDRCGVDMTLSKSGWAPVPKGFRVVWRPRTELTGPKSGPPPGTAAFAKEVDLQGVTVLGERSYGGQRFALVVLNQRDERDYRLLSDQLGTTGEVAVKVAKRASSPVAKLMRLLSGRSVVVNPMRPPQITSQGRRQLPGA